ncbi:MAG: hypothetical protein KDC12_04355 [Flavobacteriales bacterium]|nr:hypothetical protein [Flavobacteriales bacterium]
MANPLVINYNRMSRLGWLVSLIGTSDEFTYDRRILHMGIVLCSVATFVAFVVNLLLGYSAWHTSWFLGMWVLMVVAYYLSRFKGHYKAGKRLFVVNVFIGLFISWIFFNGHDGGTPVYIMSASLLVWFINRKHAFWFGLGLVAFYCTLSITEYRFPFLVDPYPSSEVRFWDITTAHVVILILLVGANWMIRMQNDRTSEKSQKRLQEIEEHMAMQLMLQQELERANRSLEQRNKELIVANEQKMRFLSIVSHDIRSPLGGLQNSLRLIESGAFSGEEREEMMKLLDRDVSLTLGMLDNLLRWAKMEMNGGEIKRESLSVAETLEDTLSLMETYAKSKQVDIEVHIHEDHTLCADKEALKLIIRNLALNAVKFSEPNSKVQITSEETDEGVVLRVLDTGAGMSEEQIASLFTVSSPGQGAKSADEGAGLGLRLCKAILDTHHGELLIANRAQGGVEATVRFPR